MKKYAWISKNFASKYYCFYRYCYTSFKKSDMLAYMYQKCFCKIKC